MMCRPHHHPSRWLTGHSGETRRPRALIAVVALATIGIVVETAAAKWGGWGGGYGGFGGGWASTAQQGADMGLAAVVRAQGYANLQNSEAAKNWE